MMYNMSGPHVGSQGHCEWAGPGMDISVPYCMVNRRQPFSNEPRKPMETYTPVLAFMYRNPENEIYKSMKT